MPSLQPILDHLWQSTLFGAALALLSLAFRKNHARTRYALWLAASVKFLIPFSVLVALGQQLAPAGAPLLGAARTIVVVEQYSGPAKLPFLNPGDSSAPNPTLPFVLVAIWAVGAAAVAFRAASGWRRVSAARRTAQPLDIVAPIPVLATASLIEPGVFGIRRPVLLMPAGITERLTPEQLDAIVAHELCHVDRRDNLTAAIHMLVETLFWFHPLTWWIGARLVEERERACDEEVVQRGNPPQVYAEGILNVCKFYLESPVACVSGVTGSNLRRRIESIMAHRDSRALSLPRKILLVAAGFVAVAGPIAAGMIRPPAPLPAVPSSRQVRISMQSDGRVIVSGATARMLVKSAYRLKDAQIQGGPAWFHTELLEIDATVPVTDTAGSRQDALQKLLADRFHLEFRREAPIQPVFSLVIANGGPRLASSGDSDERQIRVTTGRIEGRGMTLDMLANQLSAQLGRVVIDRTGLDGGFDGALEFTPGGIFTALERQFGLRLEEGRAPVEQITITRIEKPSNN